MKPAKGDFVKASVSVPLPRERACALFTGEIDGWWRRGPRYRNGAGDGGLVHLEPRLDGRVLESWREGGEERAFEVGRITAWEPPAALAFTWRASNFANGDLTLVEVSFESLAGATMVTVVHRGWSSIRADHPVRHGLPVAGFQRLIGGWWGEQLSSLRYSAVRKTDVF